MQGYKEVNEVLDMPRVTIRMVADCIGCSYQHVWQVANNKNGRGFSDINMVLLGEMMAGLRQIRGKR
jgi:hypothetical protein